MNICIMNIGFWSCIILVIPFLIIGVLFAIFKEKAAKFVSGFNSFSKVIRLLRQAERQEFKLYNHRLMITYSILKQKCKIQKR